MTSVVFSDSWMSCLPAFPWQHKDRRGIYLRLFVVSSQAFHNWRAIGWLEVIRFVSSEIHSDLWWRFRQVDGRA